MSLGYEEFLLAHYRVNRQTTPVAEFPDEEEACERMPTRYCNWDCTAGCYRFESQAEADPPWSVVNEVKLGSRK